MAGFLILSDYPNTADGKRNLGDNVGKMLWHLLYSQGFPVNDTAVEFLFDFPQDIRLGNDHWRAIETRHKPKVILALGQTVIKTIGIEGKINDLRGSVIDLNRRSRDTYVVPTFNPRELKKPLRTFADEPLEKSYFASGDIRRAIKTYREGWETPPEKFNIHPTLKHVREFVKESLKENRLLGCDLEATGLSIENSEIVTIGFAWNESEAISIPLLAEGGRKYWNQQEETEVVFLLNKLFREGRFLFQNGVGYDVPLLRARGWDFPLENFHEDTMILHHVIAPELPHRIGFISSQYGKQPFWKDSFLKKKVSIFETNQDDMRIYNCRDCVALHQIRNGMFEDIKEKSKEEPLFSKLPQVFKDEMATARVVIKMYERGVLLDKVKLTEWRKTIDHEVQEKEKRLRSLAGVSEAFNFGSPDQMRLLLYGERPRICEGVVEELEKYELDFHNYQYECTICGRKVTKKFSSKDEIPDQRLQRCPACKKEQLVKRTDKPPTHVKGMSKETKKYQELKAREDLARTAPLYKLSNYRPLETDAGSSSIDKAAITRYIQWIDKRLDTINKMTRRHVRHEEEEIGLRKTRDFLVAYADYGGVKKLQESFYDFPTWRDGRVRPQFLVTGTATGRFSCKNPNLQQLSSKSPLSPMIRNCFRAEPGHKLISVDFSNLETHIGARVMSDKILLKQLEKGLNIHDENTKTFFKVDKDRPNWTSLRKAAKIIQFGKLFYGGTDNGIFSKVITDVPDSGITLKDFKSAVAEYMTEHSDYATWVEKVQNLAKEKRISVNAYGRVRTLLGDSNAITRIALNNPVQGSAADTVAQDMVELDKQFTKKKLKTKIILQIHDELIFDVPEEEIREAGKIIHKVMNREREINGYKFRIPIDPEIGTYWGSMDSINLLTGKIEKGGKHL